MSDEWLRIKDHEAAHSVSAWLYAIRIDAIGAIHVTRGDTGLTTASAFVNTNPTHLSARDAARVGVVGFMSEARGAALRQDRDAQFEPTPGLGQSVQTIIHNYIAKQDPPDGAWRIRVDYGRIGLIPAIITQDDVRYIAAFTDPDRLLELISETQEMLETTEIWYAIQELGAIIPERIGETVEAGDIHALLNRLLPRKW